MDERVYFGKDGNGVPRRKEFLTKAQGLVPWTWWPHEEVGHNDEARKENFELLGKEDPFATPKPERLIQRILHIATNRGDLVLDSFLGSGTTAAVAHKMGRHYIGIERERRYIEVALDRLSKVRTLPDDVVDITESKRAQPRIPFGQVIEQGLLQPGTMLYDPTRRHRAKIRADGSLSSMDSTGSIHQIGARVQGAPACNGWTFWHFERDGKLICIDDLRTIMRARMKDSD